MTTDLRETVSPETPRAGLFDPTVPPDGQKGSGAFFWGVDPSTVRIAVGMVDRDGEWHAESHQFTKHPARSLERLRCIQRETERFFCQLAVKYPPAFVLVEEPGGGWDNKVEPSLAYAVGCILSCVPIVAPGALVPVASWKLQATGHGYMPGIPPAPKDAEKAEKSRIQRARAKAEKARIMAWAWRQGYKGDSQDEADALGIAHACRASQAPKPEQLALAG